MNLRRAHLALMLVWMFAGAVTAGAHTRSMSFSRWHFDQTGADVELRLSTLELSRFEAGDPGPAHFADRLLLLENGEPCAWRDPVRLARAPEGWAIYEWRVLYETPDDPAATRTIRSLLFEDIVSDHAHFARTETGAGTTTERVLTPGAPDWPLADLRLDAPAGSSVVDYIRLGVVHILEGWDHLAFVLALILMAASVGELAVIITSFTIAHSVTLAMAALGVLRPDTAAVEIHIGFSIALVAAENLWLAGGRDRWAPWLWTCTIVGAVVVAAFTKSVLGPVAWGGLALFSFCHFKLMESSPRPARLRALISFAFGLVHGFGFAGVLLEMDLSRERLVPGLLGFNLGVEAGQLAVVLLCWPALMLLGRLGKGAPRRWIAVWGSAALVTLGVFWMTSRNWA